MSDQAKGSVPWDQPSEDKQSTAGGGTATNDVTDDELIEVTCPKCDQALALGREYLGGHCLCSTCDSLLRVSAEDVGADGEGRIVVEIVEKETGKKMGDTAPTYAPDRGGAVINDSTRPVKPWPKEFKGLAGRRAADQGVKSKGSVAQDGSDPSANLLQVPCPDCGQVLALGREILGSHCLCSVCEGLMLISLKNTDGEGMKVVAEKVDKVTGEKIADAPSTSSPEKSDSEANENWENTRPVKMWAGSQGDAGEDDDMDMGLTMPVPKMDGGKKDDDMDMGLTMPVPKMDGGKKDDGMDIGLTMPVPKMEEGKEDDEMDLGSTLPVPGVDASDDIGRTMPVPKMEEEDNQAPSASGQSQVPAVEPSQTPSAPQKPKGDEKQPWETSPKKPTSPTSPTGRQGIKLAPPGATGRMTGKAPPPTSGAVPTMTTPPTKAPPPTTGSVPTLDTGQVAARSAISAESAAWKPPGAAAVPSKDKTQAQSSQAKTDKSVAEKKLAAEKKRSNPFGSAPAPPKKKTIKRRRRKGRKGLKFALMVIPLLLVALALFIMAPGIIPGGVKGREFVDGKIDQGIERLEELIAERAMNTAPGNSDAGEGGGEDLGLAPGATADPAAGTVVRPSIPTYKRDAALQKVVSQEGGQVIRRFYGASTVEEKLAFVVGRGEALKDMEAYYSGEEIFPTVRSIMFRGGTRDVETGYYYGVFDVLENENDNPRRWCVVDAGTGLYQVDWILYRQIVASELGIFLETPQAEGVAQDFTMLMKLDGHVDGKESPWIEGAVRVQMQVPMISSNWYSVLMKKSLAESLEFTTKLADGRMTIGVVKIAWVVGDRDQARPQPAIIGIKRWGAWAHKAF